MAGSLTALSAHRFGRAREELQTAELLLKNANFRSSINRSYYAIFHAIRAVNALDGFDSSKHSGVISHFNQEYVKTGIFEREASKIIRNASELREQADYEDFYEATQEEAAERVGKSRSAVANSLRLLNLPENVLELLKSGFINTGHAKVVLGLPTPELQAEAAQIIADNQLNVRQAEALCKKMAKPAKEPREPAPRGTLPVEVEESLKQVLGSEVNVAYHGGKGKLTVHFYSDEQLRAFANLLGQYQMETE